MKACTLRKRAGKLIGGHHSKKSGPQSIRIMERGKMISRPGPDSDEWDYNDFGDDFRGDGLYNSNNHKWFKQGDGWAFVPSTCENYYCE